MRFSIKLFLALFIVPLLPLTLSAQERSFGQLFFSVNLPDSFYVVLDDKLTEAIKIAPDDALQLPSGRYSVTLISGFTDDHHFDLEIGDGDDLIYSHKFETFRIDHESTYMELERGYNLVIETDPESEIFLNGISIGFHSKQLLVNPGIYTIETISSLSGRLKTTIGIDYAETAEVFRYNRPQKDVSTAYYLMPGAGYLLTEQNNKFIGTYLAFGALIASYFTIEQKMQNSRRIFDVSQLQQLKTANLIGIGVVYLITTIDSTRKPKSGYPGKPINIVAGTSTIEGRYIATGGFSISF